MLSSEKKSIIYILNGKFYLYVDIMSRLRLNIQ